MIRSLTLLCLVTFALLGIPVAAVAEPSPTANSQTSPPLANQPQEPAHPEHTSMQTMLAVGLMLALCLIWIYTLLRQRARMEINERRFQLVMNAATDGIWDWNIKTGETYYSPNYLGMLGYEPGELPARQSTWENLLHPEDRAKAVTFTEQAISQAKTRYEHDFRLRHKDGSYRHIHSKGSVVATDAHGKALRSVGAQTDVTTEKNALAELRKLSLVVEQSSSMVTIINAQGIIEYINPRITEILGHTRADCLGKNVTLFLPKSLTDSDRQQVEQAIDRGTTWSGEQENQTLDGKAFWQKMSLSPLRASDGSIGHFTLLQEDISDRKQAEENLEVFHRFAETCGRGFGMADLVGNIVYANQTLRALLEEDSVQTIYDTDVYQYYSADHRTRWQQEIVPALQSTGQWTGELKLKSAKGRLIPTYENYFLIRNDQGRPLYVGTVISDITDLKAAELELKQAKQLAEQASNFKSEFLANMSHEIRTPLNAIVGMTHLTMTTALTPRQKEYLKKAQSASHSLMQVINDILDFSKVEAGRLELETTEFLLESVFENLANIESLKATEKDLELIFRIDPSLPPVVLGDPYRLGQILINLTNNAIKFTERGQIVVAAEATHHQDDKLGLRFSVSDTGIGIDEQKRHQLFSAFTQADGSTTRRYGGTGLGLAICKSLVELMGGNISVDSRPGMGSEFSFTVELKLPKKSTLSQKNRSLPDLRGTRVLIVDDNATARETLTEMLKSMSFKVTAVHSGPAALAELERASQDQGQTSPYDLLLMDWKMPGMNGIEACQAIRASAWLPKLPAVIMVTAYGREDIFQSAQAAGIEGFLTKPINQSTLFDTIINVLQSDSLDAETGLANQHKIPDLSGNRVLIVEDNLINQQVADELLQRTGIDTQVASNALEAIQYLENNAVDLVLMDLQMPDMDGLQATRIIRQRLHLSDLPIVAMTAHALKGDRERCMDAGMTEHIAKPIDPDALYAMLCQFLPWGSHTPAQENDAQTDSALSQLPSSINVAYGLSRIGGNRALYVKLLQEFVDDHRNLIDQLEPALSNDKDAARRWVHTVRSVAGTLGAQTLEHHASQLEQALTSHQSANNEFAQFKVCFQQLLSDLTGQWLSRKQTTPSNQVEGDVDQAIETLITALTQNNASAKSLFSQYRNLLQSKIAQTDLQQLTAAIDDFEFDTAAQLLSPWRQANKSVTTMKTNT